MWSTGRDSGYNGRMERARLGSARPSIRSVVGLASVLQLALALFAAWVHAAEPAARLPRFASLRAGEINVRTGPGRRYPVEWVFVYRKMPIEIVAEFDTWRKVRDWQGIEGWVEERYGMSTVLLRLDFIGQAAAVKVDAENLEPV